MKSAIIMVGASRFGNSKEKTTKRLSNEWKNTERNCEGEDGSKNSQYFSEAMTVLQLVFWGRKKYSKVKVTQSCPNTGVSSLSLLQGIFPTQGLNPGVPHCRQTLYQLSHKGSPRTLEWAAYPFSRGSYAFNTSAPSSLSHYEPAFLFTRKQKQLEQILTYSHHHFYWQPVLCAFILLRPSCGPG